MNTEITIDGRTLNITHISTTCAGPNHLYSATYPMMVVEPRDGGANVIILRSRTASHELVIASEAFIPENFLEMVLAKAVQFNSAEGLRVYRQDARRG